MAALLPDDTGARSACTVCRTGYSVQQRVARNLRETMQTGGGIPFAALLCGGSADGSFDDHRTTAPAKSQAAGRVRRNEGDNARVWLALPPGGNELLLSRRQAGGE